VQALIESAGAEVWYLPPYSPDLNSIAAMWSKVEQRLRAPAARTFEGLISAIGTALGLVTMPDLIGWFTRCGYAT